MAQKGNTGVKTILSLLREYIWREVPEGAGSARRLTIRLVRLLYVVGRDLMHGQLTMRAASLSYATLLSLVPLLAVSFSVLQAFGVYNMLEPLLLQFLEPLGPQREEIGNRIATFVHNMRVGVLGSIGLAMLFYTVISLVNKIEKSFNYTWRVEENRSFGRRFSDYLSVILIGPVLMFSALGLSASLMSTTLVQHLLTIEPFGSALYVTGKILPKLLIIAAFAFIYVFIPNTKVVPRAALGGAVLASILWQVAGWGFASFVASSTKYAAIYSSFAILVIFLIWLYLNWVIVLIGAQTAYYIQNPGAVRVDDATRNISEAGREKLVLVIMMLITERYCSGRSHWTMEQLSEALDVPENHIQNMLELLEREGLLVTTGAQPPAWIPGRDPETIRLDELIGTVRYSGDSELEIPHFSGVVGVADDVMKETEQMLAHHLSQKNIKELVVSGRYHGEGGFRERD